MNKNIRNMSIDTGSGTDVKDTQMLKGESKASPKETNETVQFTTPAPPKDNLGGENTFS